MIQKNNIFEVDIIEYGINGEGIAKIDDFIIFVDKALKGEKCIILIIKVLKNYAYAKILKIVKKSEFRVESDCKTYKNCGGCTLRHIKYGETLKIKRNIVQNLVNRGLKTKIEVDETMESIPNIYYRNKALYPVGKKENKNIVGFFSERSHKIVPFEKCYIQSEESQEIAKYIIDNFDGEMYDEMTMDGHLRNIMIRKSSKKDIMCVLVQKDKKIRINVDELIRKFPQIKSVIISKNDKNTNVPLTTDNFVIYGDSEIEDYLGEYKFKISVNSFFQVNSNQTEKMYDLAINLANIKKDEVVCDLYSGIGTIGIYASKYAKKVICIEIVESAVKNAIENAKLNNISNIEFLLGDTKDIFEDVIKTNKKIDTIFVDPPRKGLDETTINNMKSIGVNKIVYISCNPATLVRDLAKFEDEYKIKKIIPVDNFCYTSHVECVVLLSK